METTPLDFQTAGNPPFRVGGWMLFNKVAWLIGFAAGAALFAVGARWVARAAATDHPVKRPLIAPPSVPEHSHALLN